MARFYKLRIQGTGPSGAVSIYLTDDGTANGRPCKTTIENLAALLTPQSGNTTVASDGTPFTEKPLTAGKGRPFAIVAAWTRTTVFSSVKTLIDHCAAQGTNVRITGTLGPSEFDVDAVPNFDPIPIDFEGFNADAVKGLRLRFVTSGTY